MNPALQQAQNANLGQEQYAQGQSDQYQAQVPGQQQQTNQNLQNLTNYQQQLNQPQNQLQNVYGQQLGSYNTMYGVDPGQLQAANQILAQTQNTMAALPQAIQQGANGRMVTGAQEANRYAQAAGGVQQQLGNQTNAISALQSGIGYAQNAANQATGFAGQSQQMQLGALQNEYQDALSNLQNTQQQVQYFQTLKQQGYEVTGQLENAQAALNNAAANAEAAQAAMLNAQVNQSQLVLNQQAAAQAANGPRVQPNGGGGFNYFNGNQPITAQQYGALTGKNINPLLGMGQTQTAPTQQPPQSGGNIGLGGGVTIPGLNALGQSAGGVLNGISRYGRWAL